MRQTKEMDRLTKREMQTQERHVDRWGGLMETDR